MAKRLEARKAVAGLGTAVGALREMRHAGDGPSLRYRQAVEAVGAELRAIVMRLKRVESLVIVARMALDGQDVEQDNEVAKLLKRDIGDLLFKQVRALQNVAAQCDGGLRSDREDDDEFEDDDTEDAE
jgi:hypothetical protein